ncbi:unnamed protein product, partial [Mesorhabditis spiculigera]
MAENDTRPSCEEWWHIFENINHYFRDDIVLNGTGYASTEIGYAITAAYLVVILFGAFGNFMTILVVVINPHMRTTRNFFIMNLALSDFFVCTVTAPITLYTVMFTFWPFGTLPCKIAGSLQGFNVFLSTFSIAAIALDRYVLVIFPTKRERQQNLALVFFIMIWITSLILAIPLFIASDLKPVFRSEPCGISLDLCHEQNDIWNNMWISKRDYTLGALATHYAFPLCSTVFAYSRIAHPMASSLRRRSVVERQRRTHLLLICVVAVFGIAWLPLNVFHMTNTFEWAPFSVIVFAGCHIIAMCSSCLNPLFYAFFNQNFRTEFIALFDKAGLRRVRHFFGTIDRLLGNEMPQTTKGVTASEFYPDITETFPLAATEAHRPEENLSSLRVPSKCVPA